MNQDLQALGLLLQYAQRRLVAGPSALEKRLGGAVWAATALANLERSGLVYREGVNVRLTFAGFALAVASASRQAKPRKAASVHRLGRPRATGRSHAA